MNSKFTQPSRKRKRAPDTPSATLARQDDLCLVRTILDTWAWHPQCPLQRTDRELPLEFGASDEAPAAAAADYRLTFQPFIVDEAVAQLQREANDELQAGRALRVKLRRVADLLDGKADVSCRVDGGVAIPETLRKKLRDNAFVFLCSAIPSTRSPPLTLPALCAPPANGTASHNTPTILAAWIKYTGRRESDDFLLEVQHGPSAGQLPEPRHPSATALPTLLAGLSGDTPSEQPEPWYLIVCSMPVTSQREMAALECMCRKAEFETLLRPSTVLREQGSQYYQVWPSEVRFVATISR
jgi:hypothetical protein